MLIRIGYDIAVTCTQPTHALFKMAIEPARVPDLVRPETIGTDNGLTLEPYIDAFGNRCHRGVLQPGRTRIRLDSVVRDSGLADIQDFSAREVPPGALPADVLHFLQPSRYCESDMLSQFAWSQFGHIPQGWARAQAIVDFAHNQIQFGYQWANMYRTAQGAFSQRIGVCRDYAHLGVALLRAMNIPARYCNGYLGDIGVPPDPAPMDFNAWLEAYLEGQWFTFDPRHNIPRIGRIVICRGMDATDCAMIHTFGAHALDSFRVVAEEVSPHFVARAA